MERAGAERLVGSRGRLGGTGGDDAAVDWAYGFAGRIGDRDPIELADAALGPVLQRRDADGDAPRRLAPRRDDAAADLARNSRGDDDATILIPTARRCWA